MCVGLKKKPPRRRIFECVSEELVEARPGDWAESDSGEMRKVVDGGLKYKIFKEVTA